MKVLILEDDAPTRTGLEQLVAGLGFEVRTTGTLAEARPVLSEFAPDICVTDMMLPDGDGIDFLRTAKTDNPSREVIVMTGHGSIKTAVEAMKAGAFDFLLKPLKPVQLVSVLQHFSDKLDLDHEADGLRTMLEETGRFGVMVGKSAPMQQVFHIIARIAKSDAPVMIVGESGSGKEAVAATIHELSRRRSKPMVAINCGAVSSTLIESELFGHEKGSFTGADKRRNGYFEMAQGGTLFLDEVTEMSTELQVKFLRVLETRSFRRVGGNDELNVDVRVISSSNRDLAEAVKSEKLRGDLYYRLNVFPIRLPPLRERLDDIPLLAQHFLERIEEQERAGIREIDPHVHDILSAYSWPGNVRELRNVIHRAYVLSDGPAIKPSVVESVLEANPQKPAAAGAAHPYVQIRVGQSLQDAERQLLQKTLDFVKGNKKQAAEMLKISLKTIYNKMKQYGIEG
ncbi:MAG TPA: sigma-54 dependent transcriptional regulator [Thermoanaerobaculia bacterium]|nr:sigma-54 dependent transcriptional regulator [Thermoanaerobaculia bacterium]